MIISKPEHLIPRPVWKKICIWSVTLVNYLIRKLLRQNSSPIDTKIFIFFLVHITNYVSFDSWYSNSYFVSNYVGGDVSTNSCTKLAKFKVYAY